MSTIPTTTDESVSTKTTAMTGALRRERSRGLRRRRIELAVAILAPVVLITAVEVASRIGAVDARLFPPPSAVVERGWTMLGDGALVRHVVATTTRLFVGFGIGTVAGVALGVAAGLSRLLRAAFTPVFTAVFMLPKIALLPLLLLLFGLTETPRVLAIAITVFCIVYIGTLAGLTHINGTVLDVARAYRARGARLLCFVLLPAAAPEIFTSLRVAVGAAVAVVTAVEFVASANGLGYLIWNSWQLFQPRDMAVALASVALLGTAATGALVICERTLLPWQRRPSSRKDNP